MKLDAVAVSSSDLKRTMTFYSMLGFDFSNIEEGEEHIEPVLQEGSARLMIDNKEVITEMMGETPKAANHSSFAIQYDSPSEVNEVCARIDKAGFKVAKEPWDAFWGQRYAVVQDPDGYFVDLYAYLA